MVVYFLAGVSSKFSVDFKSNWCHFSDVEHFEKVVQIKNFSSELRLPRGKNWISAITMIYRSFESSIKVVSKIVRTIPWKYAFVKIIDKIHNDITSGFVYKNQCYLVEFKYTKLQGSKDFSHLFVTKKYKISYNWNQSESWDAIMFKENVLRISISWMSA